MSQEIQEIEAQLIRNKEANKIAASLKTAADWDGVIGTVALVAMAGEISLAATHSPPLQNTLAAFILYSNWAVLAASAWQRHKNISRAIQVESEAIRQTKDILNKPSHD